MAQQPSSSSQLRALTYRISSTPPKHLPAITPQIASSIWTCRDLLCSPSDKQTPELSRFKTHLSTLLQDRTPEARWSGIILLKTTIEAGGPSLLSNANPWVKNLLTILKKPDPPTTRILAVLTLTRIFMLTWDFSNLVREITTPAMTAFVPICISNIEKKGCGKGEVQAVLEAFTILIPRHPTIFRSNEGKLRGVVKGILSDDYAAAQQKEIARRVLVLLHYCAPKQGAGEKWEETVKGVEYATHAACDRVFRAVQEDWQSEAGIEPSVAAHLRSGGELESEQDDAVGLRPWKGVYAGGERIVALLDLIRSHLSTATAGNVSVRLGLLADLLTRIFAISVPLSGKQDGIKFNNQVSKDEREALFAVLPKIHVAAIQLTVTMLRRFEAASFSWTQNFVDQCVVLFHSGSSDTGVRKNLYELFATAIRLIGPSMSRNEFAELDRVLKSCCEEVLPKADSNAQATSKINSTSGSVKQQLGLANSQTIPTHPTDFSDVKLAAQKLLRTTFEKIDATCIAPKLRAQIDRVAVLTNDKELLVASVMNPPKKAHDARVQASLLPILARQFSHDPEVEALLRPRMPPIVIKSSVSLTNGSEDVEEVEMDVEDEMDEQEDAAPTTSLSDLLTGRVQSDVQEQAEPASNASEDESMQDQSATSKRRAEEEADTASSSKRLRASLVAETLMPESTQTLPGPDPATHQTSVPKTIVGESQHQPAAAVQESSVVTAQAGAAAEDDDDDSDMELPPLTMEPDTDPEDEG